jgi:hypothetical protein
MAVTSEPALAGAQSAGGVRTRARALGWMDCATLGVIGLVVVLVTLPVLRRIALRSNELDALRTLRHLQAEDAAWSGPSLGLLLASEPAALRALEDVEAHGPGWLRRHGYLFGLERGPEGALLCAWPWEFGRTGRAAFAWSRTRGLLGTQNQGGAFDGPSRPPTPADVARGDWIPLRARSAQPGAGP